MCVCSQGGLLGNGQVVKPQMGAWPVCVCGGVDVTMEPLTKELLFCFLKELASPCSSGNINTFTLK